MTRRQALKLMGASVLGTSLLGAALLEASLLGARRFSRSELLAQSPVGMPEDLVTGRDNWYATLCPECPARCGIVVRVVEGRAIKVEGNPLYPVNRGKLCARGQAAIQALYHPDRLLSPLKRTGPRGSGQFQEIGWEEALSRLSQRLGELRHSGEANTMLLATAPMRGHGAWLTHRFAAAYGAQHVAYEPLEDTALRAGVARAFSAQRLPEWDIASARYILSFGADFLSTYLSPVRYSRAYGEFRQGPRPRGTLVQVEPRPSLTAANADLYLPISPGTEGVLALSLAYILMAEGLADTEAAEALTGGRGSSLLEQYRPERVEGVTGIRREQIYSLARSLARERPSLVLAGGPAAAHTNGLFNVSSALTLNHLLGGVGQQGGILFNPPPLWAETPLFLDAAPFAAWAEVVERMEGRGDRPINALLVYGINPVYGLPASLGLAQALNQLPFIVSFTSFLDDTAAYADLVLPVASPLETWGDDMPDPGPGYPVLGLQQPVVYPLGDTRNFADILLELARRLGTDLEQALPWSSFQSLLQAGAEQVYQELPAATRPADFATFWNSSLQQGGWWREETPWKPGADLVGPPPVFSTYTPPAFAGRAEDYPLHFLPFPSHTLYDGRSAHLPWLQATPDPLTTITWQSWVEISPQQAEELGVREGDIVVVESPYGSLEAPVYPHPLMPPGAVGMPVGQGHRDGERYSQGRGANPLSILAPLTDRETGALAWAATRVRLRPTGRRMSLPKFEGSVPALQLPGEEIVKVVPN